MSAASGGCSEPKQGQRSQSARGFCPRSTMRVPQPDIIEHFGNADAVPQPPERCLSRKAGIVRCCLKAKSRRNPLWIPRLFNAKSGCVCRNRRYFRLFRYTLAQRRNFPSFRSCIRINSSIIHKYSKSMHKYWIQHFAARWLPAPPEIVHFSSLHFTVFPDILTPQVKRGKLYAFMSEIHAFQSK